jgi:hypothetical protein
LVPGTIKFLHHTKERKRSVGIRRVAGLTGKWLLMRVNYSTGKGTFGVNKFGSVDNRINMKLGS